MFDKQENLVIDDQYLSSDEAARRNMYGEAPYSTSTT